jgi:hypothetical protein
VDRQGAQSFGYALVLMVYHKYFNFGVSMANISTLGAQRFFRQVRGFAAGAACLAAASALHAQTMLVSEAEASRPNAPELSTRGITRGPGIKLLGAPEVSAKSFSLKFEFEPRGGAHIDPKSVRLEYMKQPLIDLTDRVKAGIHDRVLEISQFAVPPGSHPLRVRVADSEGREAVHLVTLQAK